MEPGEENVWKIGKKPIFQFGILEFKSFPDERFINYMLKYMYDDQYTIIVLMYIFIM